jgi:DNA-binding LacI/PurR family transcriptional regulator
MENNTKTPKYQQIAEQLRHQIAEGKLKPNDRLPSITELISEHGVSLHTIEKAHGVLEMDGLIRREPGRGIFVDPPRANAQTGFLAYFSTDYHITRNIPYHATIQQGIRQAVHEAGKYVTIVENPREFPHWNLMEGLLISDMGHFDRKDLLKLLPPNLPRVNIMFDDPGINSVMADDVDGMRQAVEYLLSQGHRRIGYLSHLKHPTLQQRHRAYRATLIANKVTPQQEWVYSKVLPLFPNYYEYSYYAMQQWLNDGWEKLGLTAILAQNDPATIGMMKALKQHGLQVPQDVSIVGFDGVGQGEISPIDLTTVSVPLEQLGQTAVKVLLEQSATLIRQRVAVQLPVSLKIGNTTRQI